MLHIVMRNNRFFMLALAAVAALGVWAGCKSVNSTPPVMAAAPPSAGVKPGPNDPRIAYVAARLMEEFHYQQHPLDRDMSVKMFDGYVDALDPRHENFLQSDLNEFAAIRTNLDVLTIGGHGTAELAPAFALYQRFAERSQQHYNYVNELLHSEKFKFTADDKIMIDRRHEAFPKDLDEAKQLWRQRLRYEYLQEKLARELSETNGIFTVKLPTDATTNIPTTLARHYRWNQRMLTNWDSDMVLQTYLNYGLAHAYDPHSDYFGAPKAQDFSIDMNLSLFGIGAQLMEDDGYCTIKELVPGGPAMKSRQLNPEDRIVAVSQGDKTPVDAVDLELEKVVQMIRGPKGTEVRLTISPGEDRTARRVVTLMRDEIKLEDKEAKAQLIEFPDGKRLGVIDLPSFYAPVDVNSGGRFTPKYTSVDVAKLVTKLKEEKVNGIILDLRSNPGGSLEEAVKFTGLFIKDGPVVLARESTGQVMVDSDPDPGQLYDGPLVVMINRFSASASEIAAAALQDYGRALIVGDTSTHGKGTVQKLEPLRPYVWPATTGATNDPGMLKITKGKFYRVSGASTQLKGVASDIVLPDILNYSKFIGEGSLDNALVWDTIQPVSYDKYNLVQPYLPELERRSQERLVTNQDYLYIKQDIDQFVKTQADRSATLNEKDAIAEHERTALTNIARAKELENRALPNVKIYDLTLKDADKPGLPAQRPFYVTNNIVSGFSDFTIQQNDKSYVLYAFTNKADYFASAITNYVETNHIDWADIKIVYTNSAFASSLLPNEGVTTATEASKPVVTKSYAPDPTLDETERILRDYISLLSKSSTQTTSHVKL